MSNECEERDRLCAMLIARETAGGPSAVRAIAAALDAAAGMADDFLAGHPKGCGCGGCDGVHNPDATRRVLVAIGAAARVFNDQLVCASEVLTLHGDGGTHGDDLREAARYADRADELYDRNEDAGDVVDAPDAVINRR